MADLVGHTLGNYRIEAPLGSGGMGEVYRAIHTRLERPAAIKILHASQAADPTFQARFLREARAAAALSHPNIVEVFDFGEEDGSSYLVMELVPNGSLRTLLRQRAREQGWTLGLGVDLVRQAAEGLAYAHTHGMVHRDIKPDNLLLQRLDMTDADKYLLKISDFGLARMMDDGGDLTVTGMVMGTPTYMSPEQCQGGDLDGRSDLYSLGVVLYEVATGSPPFRVKSLSEAVFKHISAAPAPPRSVQPDLPPALENVILRCLEKRPEDRFATGHELAEALDGALDGALGDTKLRTVISTRPSNTPAIPTPVVSSAPYANAMAPKVAKSPPGAGASTPYLANAPAAPRPQPAAGGGAARVVWPQVNDAEATVASAPTPPPTSGADMRGALLRRRRMLAGIGAGAMVVALLIVFIAIAARGGSGKTSANGVTSTHATATTKPVPTPTPIEKVTYQNSLNTFSSQWPITSRAYFNDNGYEVNGAYIAFAPPSSPGDGTISVRMRQLGGPSDQFYGILFRGQGSAVYYFFGIAQNQQWTFSIVTNGNGSSIVAPTLDTHIVSAANASNTITVRSRGSHFVFYINGVQVGQADDTRLASGQIGLINTAGHLQVVYNDFSVTVPGQ